VNKLEILNRLSEHKVELKSRYAISSLSLFGSIVRDRATAKSDLDIIVEFQKPPGLFKFLELKAHLEDLFQCPVDLVTKNALKKQLREKILQEALNAI
jgi:predicted nucleotidyltransferase